MADNVPYTPGSGVQIAADDIGGVLHQRTKIEFGEDGSATDVSATHPLPVVAPATDSSLADLKTAVQALSTALPLPSGAATDAALATLTAAVQAVQASVDEFADDFEGLTDNPDFESTATPTRGIDAAGNQHYIRTDVWGNLTPSDATGAFYGQAQSATVNPIIVSMDTTGYQSISIQLYGTWAGTVTFQGSNDGSNWVAVAGYQAGSGVAVVSSGTGSGLFTIPAIGRFFRAIITAYTSGIVLAAAFLRQQPMPVLSNVPQVNTQQIGGTAVVTAGVSGLQAVGGNIAVGTAPTSNPVPVGAVDSSGLTRRVLTDTTGQLQVIARPDSQLMGNVFNVATEKSSQAQDGLIDALNNILTELRYMSLLLRETPFYLNQGKQMTDEVTQFTNSTVPNFQ